MTFPEPHEGLVVRYAYLWKREHEAGRREGVKDRPCAIVLSVIDRDKNRQVLVLPVTHTPPQYPDDAIELPAATKTRLGLDSARSWIVISEANRFVWPGPDLRPIAGRDASSVVYGMLPPGLFAHVRRAVLKRIERNRTKSVPRLE